MKISRILTLAAAALALSASLASAQALTARAGTLSCGVAPGISFIFGSTRAVNCIFYSVDGVAERYVGEISRWGVDIGFTNAAGMAWLVLAAAPRVAPGALSGTYVGAAAGATVGVGAAANVLLGGGKSFALQPLSVEGNTGLNVAAGVGELRLRK